MTVLWIHTGVNVTQSISDYGLFLEPCVSRWMECGVRVSVFSLPLGWLECGNQAPGLTRSPHRAWDSLSQPPHFTRGGEETGCEQAAGPGTQRLDSHSGSRGAVSPDSRACDSSATLCWYAVKIPGLLSLSGSRLYSLCLKDVPRMWDGKWFFNN